MQHLTPRHMKLASKAALVSAVLGLVNLFILIFHPYLVESLGLVWTDTLIMLLVVAGLGLLIFVMRTVQAFLNQCFSFHDADLTINLIICFNVAIAILAFVGLLILDQPNLEEDGLGWQVLLHMILVVALGASIYTYSNRIARLDDDLWGMMRPYYICTKAGGLCFLAAIVPVLGLILIFGGVVFSMATDLLLSKIFARAAQEMESLIPPEDQQSSRLT
jgi:hypothetical protein